MGLMDGAIIIEEVFYPLPLFLDRLLQMTAVYIR
jgi:hypothetical protein